MQFIRSLQATAVASLLSVGAANAAMVNVAASTLDDAAPGLSTSYSALDALGTTLTVQAGESGSLGSIVSGPYQGLWFGGNQGTATYTFSFSNAISAFGLHINAMSTSGSLSEVIGAFTLDNEATPSFAFTNIAGTRWDGSSVSSSIGAGEFSLEVSVAPGHSFNSISFLHTQQGLPNGSVVRDIAYVAAAPVPEPETYALMLLGLAGVGIVARRRR